MIHVSDIEADLAARDLRGLEAAFRALVDYPDEDTIEGAESADQLADLLHRVAVALEADAAIMPRHTVAALVAVMSGPLYDRADYAAGSTIVREHKAHWHAIFARDAGARSSRAAASVQ